MIMSSMIIVMSTTIMTIKRCFSLILGLILLLLVFM